MEAFFHFKFFAIHEKRLFHFESQCKNVGRLVFIFPRSVHAFEANFKLAECRYESDIVLKDVDEFSKNQFLTKMGFKKIVSIPLFNYVTVY